LRRRWLHRRVELQLWGSLTRRRWESGGLVDERALSEWRVMRPKRHFDGLATTRPSAEQNPRIDWPYTVYKDMEMQLNEREASLVDAFRRLPPDAATELSALAARLAELAPSHRIDWSDSWSDEDMNDFRTASLRRFDAEESEDRD
jgi:hypothetical protein